MITVPAGIQETSAVLLVDDDPDTLILLERILAKDGHKILTAAGALAAFELLATHHVGVIVSDQNMDEMPGVEFFKRAKVMYPNVVRIMLSGYDDFQTVADAINEGGVYKFFVKQRDNHLLRSEIRKAFQRNEALAPTG